MIDSPTSCDYSALNGTIAAFRSNAFLLDCLRNLACAARSYRLRTFAAKCVGARGDLELLAAEIRPLVFHFEGPQRPASLRDVAQHCGAAKPHPQRWRSHGSARRPECVRSRWSLSALRRPDPRGWRRGGP